MDSLSLELGKSIVNKGTDIGVDLSEVFLDSIMEDGILKDIPIVSTISTMYKAGKSISEYIFVKKILNFINEYNKAIIDSDKLEQLKSKFESDEKYKKEVLETLILIIDRLDNEWKSTILACLFIEYINGQYSWEEFQDLSRIVEQLFLSDIKVIRNLIEKNESSIIKNINIKTMKGDTIKGSVERLKSYGFIEFEGETWESIGDYNEKSIKLTSLGGKFYNQCLHNWLYNKDNG